jgi:putative oxidoreductase
MGLARAFDQARAERLTYALLRFMAGAMFVFHGIQKLFGELTTKVPPAMWSQKWFGGVIELVAGVLLAVGLFTRPAAILASGTMAVAYWQFHALEKGSVLPIQNGGELAALYCFVFLFFAARGGGSISLDRHIGRA